MRQAFDLLHSTNVAEPRESKVNDEARMSNDEPRQTIQLFVKGFSFI